MYRDVFVHDTLTGTTELVSRTPAGVSGNQTSVDPAISFDGRFIAFRTYAGRIMTAYFQTAAFLRSMRREGGDDHMPARRHRAAQCFHILPPVHCIREKMKHCAVMPQCKRALWGKRRHIRHQPFHLHCLFPKTSPCVLQGRVRNVQHGQSRISGLQQMIHHPLTDKGIETFRNDWAKARAAASAKAKA